MRHVNMSGTASVGAELMAYVAACEGHKFRIARYTIRSLSSPQCPQAPFLPEIGFRSTPCRRLGPAPCGRALPIVVNPRSSRHHQTSESRRTKRKRHDCSTHVALFPSIKMPVKRARSRTESRKNSRFFRYGDLLLGYIFPTRIIHLIEIEPS